MESSINQVIGFMLLVVFFTTLFGSPLSRYIDKARKPSGNPARLVAWVAVGAAVLATGIVFSLDSSGGSQSELWLGLRLALYAMFPMFITLVPVCLLLSLYFLSEQWKLQANSASPE